MCTSPPATVTRYPLGNSTVFGACFFSMILSAAAIRSAGGQKTAEGSGDAKPHGVPPVRLAPKRFHPNLFPAEIPAKPPPRTAAGNRCRKQRSSQGEAVRCARFRYILFPAQEAAPAGSCSWYRCSDDWYDPPQDSDRAPVPRSTRKRMVSA